MTKNVATTSHRNALYRSKSLRVGETTECKVYSVDTDELPEIFSLKRERGDKTRYE